MPAINLLVGLLLCLSCGRQISALAAKDAHAKFERNIDVLLAEADSVVVGGDGEIIIETYQHRKQMAVYYSSMTIQVLRQRDGMLLRDSNGIVARGVARVVFRPRFPTVFLRFGGGQYRGAIKCAITEIEDGSKRTISVVNHVDIEDYLRGVLPGEIGQRSADEYEALKAQAIVARTYAVWRILGEGRGRRLRATIEDQLYLGAASEMELHSRAVAETEGMVLTYDGRPIAAYFHAVCGGSTIPREKAWGGNNLPYLQGTDDSGYCRWANSFAWKEVLSAEHLHLSLSKYLASEDKLPARGLGRLYDIHFTVDSLTGRVAEMRVVAATGEYRIYGDKIRWALGRQSIPGAILPSTRFSYRLVKDAGTVMQLELEGTGNGHGVGMCQCGAIGRARSGATYQEILKVYYHGVQIEKIY